MQLLFSGHEVHRNLDAEIGSADEVAGSQERKTLTKKAGQ